MRSITNRFSGKRIILYLMGIIPVTWIGFKCAPYLLDKGITGVLENADDIVNNPFHIVLVRGSLKVVLYLCLFYAVGIGLYLSNDRNYRRREEHGSAKWGDPGRINRKYRDKTDEANKILTQNVRIGFDGHKHMRNVNVLVVGGSGAGKTRFYCKPNILNASEDGVSMVVLDPKGDTVRSTGAFLEAQGLDVRILDLGQRD